MYFLSLVLTQKDIIRQPEAFKLRKIVFSMYMYIKLISHLMYSSHKLAFLIATGFSTVTTDLIGAGVGIAVVFSTILGKVRNSYVRGLLFFFTLY